MQHIWNDFVAWFYSDAGGRVISGAIVPFVAIVLAAIIAAGIGRGSSKRIVAMSDRQARASAVTALVTAARTASVWNTVPVTEQTHFERLISEADIHLRLLPVPGSGLAADWAAHEIADLQKSAVSFSFQAEQTLFTFRERLIEWQAHPHRAKRLFKNDLDAWAYDSSLADQDLAAQQRAWAAQQDDSSTLDAFGAESAHDETYNELFSTSDSKA
jgi:hypothetical protein